MNGFLVVIEGAEAVGKSSMVEHFVGEMIRDFNYESVPHFTNKLHDKFSSITRTFEPSNSEIGKNIRKVLKGEVKVSNAELKKMFIDDRDIHMKEVEKFLKDGSLVIMDRYFYSNAAYQAHSKEECDEILKENRKRFREPDLLIYLEVDHEISKHRINQRLKQTKSQKEIFDDEESLKRVTDNYNYIIPESALRFDTAQYSSEEIANKISEEILKRAT